MSRTGRRRHPDPGPTLPSTSIHADPDPAVRFLKPSAPGTGTSNRARMNRPAHLPPLPDEARLVFRSAGPSEGERGAGEAGARGEGGGASGFFAGEEPAPLEEILARPLNWQLVVLLAEREKAVARLHHLLAKDHSGVVPEAVLAHLGRVAQVEAFRAMVLEQRLEQLLDALEGAEIPVLLLKGAAMARTIYPSFSDRPMGDLDLLVPPAHAHRARKVAEGLGWRLPEGFAEEAFPEADHHHLPPLTDGTALNLGLDLHTRISGTWEPRGLGPSDLWRRSPLLPGRSVVRVPDAADLLLHVCTHYAWSHMLAFGTWKAFRDLAVLLAEPRWSRPEALARMEHARAHGMVWWTVEMARGFAGVPVPPWHAGLPAPPVPRWVRRRLVRHFAARAVDLQARIPLRVSRWAWELALRPERAGVMGRRPWSNDDSFAQLQVGPRFSGEEGGPSRSTDSPWARIGSGARHVSWVLTR